MPALVIVSLIVAVPFVLGMSLRVSSTLLFVSIMAGSVLAAEFADDASLVISGFAPNGDPAVIAQLALLFLPIVLMLLLARRTIGKSMVLLQFVPVLFACVLLGMIALDMLPGSIASEFYASNTGAQVEQARSLIVGAAVVSQLLFVWATQRPEHRDKKHHGKSKHH